MESVVSITMGIGAGISGVLGWFGRKFKSIDDRLAGHSRDIIMLQAQNEINEARHEDNVARLERIDAKQDVQMELLNDIQSRCGPHSH